jgi:hypothetical protein
VTQHVFEAWEVEPLLPAIVPVISSVWPAVGPATGGEQVTITGSHVDLVGGVAFGNVPGTNISVDAGGTQLTVTTPPHATGIYDVDVAGVSDATLAHLQWAYSFDGTPTIRHVWGRTSPPTGRGAVHLRPQPRRCHRLVR